MKVVRTLLSLGFLSIFSLVLTQPATAQKAPQGGKTARNDVTSTKAPVIWRENAELTTKNIGQNRDLKDYEDGGYFDCRSWRSPNDSQRQCDEEKIRDFIWDHWTNKKRGYIRFTYNSVDATSTSHIFIEPNQ